MNAEGKGLALGVDLDTGQRISVPDQDRLQGLYIIGRTGTGKTTLLRDLILQDAQAGHGLCVIDPHGDLAETLLHNMPQFRENDVVLLDPTDTNSPFGLNPYWCENPGDVEFVGRTASRIVDLFERLWGAEGSLGNSWGPRLAQFLRNTAITLIQNPGLTMAEIPVLLRNAEFREHALHNVTNEGVLEFWREYNSLRPQDQRDRSESTLNKFDEFLSQELVRNIIGQSRTSVSFREFMDQGKVVLIPLSLGRLGSTVTRLLGSVIVLEILNAALSREDMPFARRRQFNLYVDEFQYFSSPAFSDLLTDARKYGIATTLAHQTRIQLDPESRGATLNAGSLVVFGVQGGDAEALAKEFNRRPPEEVRSTLTEQKTISQDPISHLVRHGHAFPNVRIITSQLLSPFYWLADTLGKEDAVETPPVPEDTYAIGNYIKNGVYYTTAEELHRGFNYLREYLVDAMEGRLDPWDLDAITRVIGVASLWSGVLGIRADAELWRNSPYQEAHWINSPPSDSFLAALAAIAVALADRESDALAVAADALMDLRMDALCSELTSDSKYRSGKNYRRITTRRARYQSNRVIEFAIGITQLALSLKEAPILINSGQFEELADRSRTYADMEGQIANNLVDQPSFTATCRVSINGRPEEHRIHITHDFGGSMLIQDEAHASADTIRSLSREAYGRPRSDVEQQLQSRRKLSGDDDHGTSRSVPI